MEHIEHLGIAVKDLEASILMYEVLLNTKCYKREEVKSENVITAFFQSGPNKVELLQATSEDSAIHKFIENEQPKRGADNKLICFVHPKDTSGVLMELCQEISE
jgi:methylmalonyl-CoA/ethylmalonyl-CoA epimerase